MRYLSSLLLFACLPCALVAGPAGDGAFIRGMTLSSHRYGEEWEMPATEAAIERLRGMGVGWIALHPYARIDDRGRLAFDPDPDPERLVRPIRWAHARGMKVMLIPHIDYFGTRFLWRGEIDFPDRAGWELFFAAYRRWIVPLADFSERHGVDLFCVGLEYVKAQPMEREWREIIGAVRGVYRGPITYGANWWMHETVRFWDALDHIGILAYFPLSEEPDPDAAALDRGWDRRVREMDKLAKRHGRKILFVEVGYNDSPICAREPWDFHQPPSPSALALRARCVDRALALEGRWENLAGMFWWKWFPDVPGAPRETFDLREPLAAEAIRARWAPGADAAGE